MTAVDWVVLVGGVVGLIAVASFTNVVIDRLPLALEEPNEYGESWDTRPWREAVGGRSRCSNCGTEIRPIDNVPIVSYLVLRGRCRECRAPYGAFHVAVEVGVPVVGVLVAWNVVATQGWTWMLLPYLFLVPVGAAVSVIDLRTMIVPTRLVWPATAVAAVLVAVACLLEGEPRWMLGSLFGILALAGPLFLVWFLVPTGMGYGDVRLSVLLGIVVGVAGASTGRGAPWGALLGGCCLFLAAIVGLVMSIPFLGAGRRKIPFGPALVIAALVCVALAEPILVAFG